MLRRGGGNRGCFARVGEKGVLFGMGRVYVDWCTVPTLVCVGPGLQSEQ